MTNEQATGCVVASLLLAAGFGLGLLVGIVL